METRIREIRAEKGWTVRRLAEESGVDKNTISEAERGKRNPNPITMHKLAKALEVEVRDLFPLGQPTLPLEDSPTPSTDGGLTLEEIRPFLEERAGSSWIALPDEEWKDWWRFVSRDEAKRRIRQIRAEAALLAEEFMATYGKADREPELVPRGQHWGDVYFKIYGRKFGAEYYAPGRHESEHDFKKRWLKDLARAEYFEKPEEISEQTLRTSAEAG